MPQLIEFALSLILLFFMLSMVVSSLTEYWNSRIGKNFRSGLLYEALLKMLNDEQNRNFAEPLYRHPLIEKSKPSENDLPAYIDSKNISTALIEIVIKHQQPYTISYDKEGKPLVQEPEFRQDNTFEHFKTAVDGLHTSDLKILLQSFLHHSGNLEELKQQIANWFNSYMDRVSGWYKRRLRRSLFFTGLIVCMVLNADFFRISQSLWNNTQLRKELAAQANSLALESSTTDKNALMDKLSAQMEMNSFPIGWKSQVPQAYKSGESESKNSVLQLIKYNWSIYFSWSTVIGWFIMAFALHLGAQFWFEALIKLINIRGAGVKPS
jgi:hypothetical protein